MIVYHLSKGLDDEIREFVPRIPEARQEGEDDSIKRICVADSIEGCLSAMPISSDVSLEPNKTYPFCYYTVYELEAPNYIKGSRDKTTTIISNEQLIEQKLVPDAKITEEHWITQSISRDSDEIYIKNVYIIKIDSEKSDIDVIEYAEGKEIDSYTNINYIKEDIDISNDEIIFYDINIWDESEDEEGLPTKSDFKELATNLGLTLIGEEEFTGMAFQATREENIRSLFEMDFKRRNGVKSLLK
ncbi:hypothetical protein ACERII_25750 [Evansella sp. AB-rgal1]|uniref:hypothetical protein n=1 Tax=Evansella sp. AB-rgal1 TaxID=3242696 RepID=UPI00359E4DBC